MMCDTILIASKNRSDILNNMIKAFMKDNAFEEYSPQRHINLKNKKIVFAVELNSIGVCPYILDVLNTITLRGKDALLGSIACVLIKSPTLHYTKSFSQQIIFIANSLGCTFIGHPVVEAIEGFLNFRTWQKNLNMPLEEICYYLCRGLSDRFFSFKFLKKQNPKVSVLHASYRDTSNTLTLWYMIKKYIDGVSILEHHVENGTIQDCIGCPFKTCLYFAKQKSCFYGGSIVKEIFPAIEEADAAIFICPNYNDAISANLSAVINRITALYRRNPFYDKMLFSVIVSGNSGGDSVAKQLIGALNINKGFILPPYFAIMEIANDMGEIKKVENIENKAQEFAQNIVRSLC
ncbi:Multimeric flavodoxin WrbA [Caloramator proteoclasticus DSM 10124]|uniref:Multimeric flavodoxin WrbA n=2 Tax=Caloramator TaxID=44258 RepID=A0A1M4WIG4_9CLOT|nr:Multimeric flavodoxin WrbA [Caloramator proteoclasticus DSM 10124]